MAWNRRETRSLRLLVMAVTTVVLAVTVESPVLDTVQRSFEIALIARLLMDSQLLEGRATPTLSTAAADVVAVIEISPMLAACDLVAVTLSSWIVAASHRHRHDAGPWLTFEDERLAAIAVASEAVALT